MKKLAAMKAGIITGIFTCILLYTVPFIISFAWYKARDIVVVNSVADQLITLVNRTK